MRSALRVLAAVAAVAAIGATPAQADVPPGFDLFETDPEATVFHFREEFTIPPNFFGDGSDPFTGSVRFGGEPIDRFNNMRVGDADTIVRRPEAAQTPEGRTDQIPIELVQLNLVSVMPLAVNYPGGLQELWDAKVSLSPTRPSQGAMRIQQQGTAGTFDSAFEVTPAFNFRRICRITRRRNRPRCVPEAAGPTRTIDVGQLQLSDSARQQLVLQANGTPWKTECDLPALTVPGLNDAFCPSSTPEQPRVLTEEESRLAKHGIRPAPPRLEHFKCYSTRARRFRPRTVLITDQFGAERARVRGPRSLCAPVRKNSELEVDSKQAHLQCYGIARAEQKVRPPQFVFTRNQFGPLRLRVGRPRSLCVPSLKSRTRRQPQAADPPVERVLDHFKCYGVRTDIIQWQPRKVRLRDQFGGRTVRVLRPEELCLPAKKNNEAAGYPVRHLLCYRVQHLWRPLPVRIDNQFGTQFFRVVRPFTLCVPTLKVWRQIPPPEEPPPTDGPPTDNPPPPPDNPPPPPPDNPPPFNGSGRFEPFNPGEVTFIIRFNQQTNGFRIVVPGGRTITNHLPPSGFNCQPSDINNSPSSMEAYDCIGDLGANTDATGRLQTNPQPQPNMGGQLFGRQGSTTHGPFEMTGP